MVDTAVYQPCSNDSNHNNYSDDDETSSPQEKDVKLKPTTVNVKGLRTTTFNLEPEIIPRQSTVSRPSDASNFSDMETDAATEAQLKEIRERSRRKIKKLVAVVGVSLTILCIILVVVSLSFGPKLEKLGDETKEHSSPFGQKDSVTPFQKNDSNDGSRK